MEDSYSVSIKKGGWNIHDGPSLDATVVGRVSNKATVIGELRTIDGQDWIEASGFEGDHEIYDHVSVFWVYFKDDEEGKLTKCEQKTKKIPISSLWSQTYLWKLTRKSCVIEQKPSWTQWLRNLLDTSGGEIPGDVDVVFKGKKATMVQQRIVRLRDMLRSLQNEMALTPQGRLDGKTLSALRAALATTAEITAIELGGDGIFDPQYFADQFELLLGRTDFSALATEKVPPEFMRSMDFLASDMEHRRMSLRTDRRKRESAVAAA